MTAERFLARPLSDGWLLWHTAEPGGVAVLMPAPDPAWPASLQGAYMARVEANVTGRCPICSTDLTMTPVAPRQASAVLAHEAHCPAGDESWARQSGAAGMTTAELEAERRRLLEQLRDGNTNDLPRADLDRIFAELHRIERDLRRSQERQPRPTS